ncbi:MAG: hypothetical protein JWP75_1067 [Frondihabitans sp.]|nr:hypothetical protein [Frondihabitans sp.]
MRTEAKRPRRIWPWLAIGAAILAALVIAIVVVGHGPTGPPRAAASPSRTSASPAPGNPDPTGCLGGNTRDAAMILKAVNSAGQGTSGAVDVAASFTRWIQRYPYPTAAEADEVGASVLAKDAFTSNLADYLASKPDLSGGIVSAGTTYYMNTVPGVWYVESSSPSRVTVSIGSGYVIDGSLSPTLRSSITVTLVLEDKRWKVATADGTRTPTDLYRIGHPLTGGC